MIYLQIYNRHLISYDLKLPRPRVVVDIMVSMVENGCIYLHPVSLKWLAAIAARPKDKQTGVRAEIWQDNARAHASSYEMWVA